MDITGLLIRRVTYPLWVWKNASGKLRFLDEFERAQFRSVDEVRQRQWSDFTALVRYAYEESPFYRQRYAAAGVRPEDLRSPEDVALLPTISKADVQDHLEEMLARKGTGGRPIRDMTGGSTGSPMVFYYDAERLDRRVAATIRHNRWAGWDIGDRAAALWGAPRDLQVSSWGKALRRRLVDRIRMLDASAIDEERMRRFAAELRRYRPHVIQGYANTLGLFAAFLKSQGIEAVRPRGIVSSAEVLTAENRALIEEVFGCRVFDRYGSRELGIVASECGAGGAMHVNAENVLVEVLVDGVPRLGQDGEVVATDLQNYVMPLIRYRTMDVGRLHPAPCPCGRGLPLLTLSGGRTTDFLLSAAGQKVSGIVLATYVITNITGIGQVQFHQDRPRHVAVHVVPGPAWSQQSGAQLAAKVRAFLGQETEVEIVHRREIPREASGKYTFSRSTVGGGG